MDTDSDFIRPEFLNIIFFQQKNLVVFPYVDLKHLHGLEKFTVGYNVVDLESTALHNLKEILEFENTNSYSQNPTLYFIYNVDRDKVKEIMELDGIRCIINSNENISNLANGSSFIFYNKKNNQFLNYELTNSDLEFENSLISNSQDEIILQENIQKIKIVATRIFKELNQSGTLDNLPDILSEYDNQYWNSILDFTSRYYDINIPDVSAIKFKPRKKSKDFTEEYGILVSTNRALGKEFIQLLHDYRSKKVNPAHLELEELYNPQKLYNYLRNHHWKEGIPRDFIDEWYQMNHSNYTLTERDQEEFNLIFRKLSLENSKLSEEDKVFLTQKKKTQEIEQLPSLHQNWIQFKQWILKKVDCIEVQTNNLLNLKQNSFLDIGPYLLQEFAEILQMCGFSNHIFKQKIQNQKKLSKNNELLIVDITNILNGDKDENGAIKTGNILIVNKDLKSRGYDPIMIADANMRHFILDDPQLYEKILKEKFIIQAPAGREADEYVLDMAKKWNCNFLTNDMYKQYWKEFGREWIFEHRLTGILYNGELSIR